MKITMITYKTPFGRKNIYTIPKLKPTQTIICHNNKPMYFIDCFDFTVESNMWINSWFLAEEKTIKQLLKKIKREKKVHLSVSASPLFGVAIKTEVIDIELVPLPLEWVVYQN